LIPHKGVHYLLDAFITAKENNSELSDKKLVIIGDGYHTNTYVAALQKKAKSRTDIIFTGFLTGEPLQQMTAHAALMVHPSDQEGLPISVLEGMSYGLPILLSDIPEHKQIVQDSQWLFRHGDVAHLCKQLTTLLTTDKHLLDESGEKNRLFVNTEYNWEHLVHRVMETYKETQAMQFLKKQKTLPQVIK
jgi:glycosyltransferase involved in cell wall biosynthesis